MSDDEWVACPPYTGCDGTPMGWSVQSDDLGFLAECNDRAAAEAIADAHNRSILSKPAVLRALLAEYPLVHVTVEPTVPGLQMPAHIVSAHEGTCIGVNLGYNLPVPIPDLVIGEENFTATLSFAGVFHAVTVPWDAVAAASAGTEDAPMLVVWGLGRMSPEPEPVSKPALRVVKGGG